MLLSKLVDDLNDKNASGLSCVNTSTPADDGELRCAERFFLDNSSNYPVCIPLCKSWLTVKPEDVAFSICLMMAVISSIILLIVAKIQKDTMYTKLPSIVYQCLYYCYSNHNYLCMIVHLL